MASLRRLEPRACDGEHKVALVLEVVIGRGGADPGLARHRAQRQGLRPVALQHPLGGEDQRTAQVAVVIGAVVGSVIWQKGLFIDLTLTFYPNAVKIILTPFTSGVFKHRSDRNEPFRPASGNFKRGLPQ